ncbi:MAG: hypothetical protein CSB48_00445 [Proteobacteria bacterium]|nr:MAG: hypothetical protein CSB48_00445 [Pseudomonadota bacterium]
MGITLFTDGSRKYYRVTRAWNGKEHQVYVRIGKSEKKALKEAERVESDLEQRRTAYYERKKLSGEGLVHEDGKIVGLQLQTRTREGRKPCTEFKIRIKEPEKAARFKSVSVNAYGIEQAFQMSVEKICELRDIDKHSPVYARLLNALPVYQSEYYKLTGNDKGQTGQVDHEPCDTGIESARHGKEKHSGFLDQLKDSLQDFLKNRRSKPD